MSIEQHETFLKSVKVPLRLSVADDNQPLIVPLWFIYNEGVLWCACHRNSYIVGRLSKLMCEQEDTWPCAFDISTNEIPYKGVAGTGVLALDSEEGADSLQKLVGRYLGTEETDFSRWLLSRAADEVALCIKPVTVRAWDFSERMQDVEP